MICLADRAPARHCTTDRTALTAALRSVRAGMGDPRPDSSAKVSRYRTAKPAANSTAVTQQALSLWLRVSLLRVTNARVFDLLDGLQLIPGRSHRSDALSPRAEDGVLQLRQRLQLESQYRGSSRRGPGSMGGWDGTLAGPENPAGSASASFRSRVSNPSVNQPSIRQHLSRLVRPALLLPRTGQTRRCPQLPQLGALAAGYLSRFVRADFSFRIIACVRSGPGRARWRSTSQ